jgi:hypothetical protein
MPAGFMTNYYSALSQVGITGFAQIPACTYFPCSSSAIVDYPHKSGQTACPPISMTTCIQNLTIQNNGAMGALNANQKAQCGVSTATGTNTGNGNGSTGSGDDSGDGDSGGDGGDAMLFSFLPATLFGLSQTIYVFGGLCVIAVLVLVLVMSSNKPKPTRKRKSRLNKK